jgi:hypothetical protein
MFPVLVCSTKKNLATLLLSQGLLDKGCIPLTMGGDHLISYPILRAVAAKYGPVALIHVDAHSDTAEHQVTTKMTLFRFLFLNWPFIVNIHSIIKATTLHLSGI